MYDVPVLIAGAGPAGLAAAITLARYGIPLTLVERRDKPSSHPKATVVSTRSMELIRRWGLEKEVFAGATDVEWLAWSCETLADPTGVALDVGYPPSAEALAVSPNAPACVPQDHLETLFLDHVRGLPSTRVLCGVEVVGVEAGSDPVRVRLRDRATGAQSVVTARYVIGADGARSATRDAAGLTMTEPAGTLTAVSALFRAPLWDLLGERRHGIYFVSHPDAAGSFIPAGGDRWTHGVIVDADPATVQPFSEPEMRRRIRVGSGVPDLDIRIEGVQTFTSAAQLADRFRRGNIFIAGDAAHRVTPRGGTGMNIAIHGAYNLAWKLAWVLRGWADDALLDSYEAERRPAAAHNVARSADPGGSLRDFRRELEIDLGGRVPHVWLYTPQGRVSTLDLIGDGLTLFTASDGGAWSAAATGHRVPVEAHELDETAARAMALEPDGAILVRPDGRPVARWSTTAHADAEVRAAVRACTDGSPLA